MKFYSLKSMHHSFLEGTVNDFRLLYSFQMMIREITSKTQMRVRNGQQPMMKVAWNSEFWLTRLTQIKSRIKNRKSKNRKKNNRKKNVEKNGWKKYE